MAENSLRFLGEDMGCKNRSLVEVHWGGHREGRRKTDQMGWTS